VASLPERLRHRIGGGRRRAAKSSIRSPSERGCVPQLDSAPRSTRRRAACHCRNPTAYQAGRRPLPPGLRYRRPRRELDRGLHVVAAGRPVQGV
jgi:hypothetical protein